MQCLLERPAETPGAKVTAHLRFLQLQVRTVEELSGADYDPVDGLVVDGTSVLSWQEAFECEVALPAVELDAAFDGRTQARSAPLCPSPRTSRSNRSSTAPAPPSAGSSAAGPRWRQRSASGQSPTTATCASP